MSDILAILGVVGFFLLLVGVAGAAASINDLKTRAEVLLWYLQMNGGGTPHSRSELLRVQKLLEAEMGK